jgi:HKD family nuclease
MPQLSVAKGPTEFIDNSSSRLNDLIVDELEKSNKVMIAVAYATIPQSHEFMRKLKEFVLKRKRKAHVIVGLGYENTDPKCLEALLAIQDRSKGRLSCKVSIEERFHPKLYVFEKLHSQVTVIIGSSNLTPEGLERNIEANVVTHGHCEDPLFTRCKQFFYEDLWRSKTLRRLSSRIIISYKLRHADKQRAIESSKNKKHIRKLQKSFDDALSEELTPWNGFDESFMNYVEQLCKQADQRIESCVSYSGFRDFGNHILLARFFDTLIKKMAENGFIYVERKRARYPEEEVVDEMYPGTSAYFQRCFKKKKWKGLCRLFVYFIFGYEEKNICTGSLVICLDFVGRNKGIRILETKISTPRSLREILNECRKLLVRDYVIYSSEKHGPLKDIDELGSLPKLVKRNTKWNRVSLEHYLCEDVLEERRRFSSAQLLNEMVEQCNEFSRLSDLVLARAMNT